MPNDFYLYLNTVHDRAIVHHGSCGYCNWGKGTQGVSDAERRIDEWQSYPSVAEALAAARGLGYETARVCGRCSGTAV